MSFSAICGRVENIHLREEDGRCVCSSSGYEFFQAECGIFGRRTRLMWPGERERMCAGYI